MRSLVLASIITALFFSNASPTDLKLAQRLLLQGDSLYQAFDYPGSAAVYRQAAQADSSSFESFWKLGRSLNLEGETAPVDSQLMVFDAARDAARRAIALDNNSADAHFQLARALGKIALFKGVFKSIGLAKQVKVEADKALALDSLHDGAWHILGRWNREVARKPKIFRGPLGLGAANKKDAVAFMRKAIALNPNLIHHHLEMGITYEEYGMDGLAKEEFNKCIDLPWQSPLDNKYKEEAKKYLAEEQKR